MGTLARKQVFPYSFKTVGVVDQIAIGMTSFNGKSGFNMIGLEIVLPQNFYACQGLYAHFRFQHDGSQAGRNITSVYVADDTLSATYTKTVPYSVIADGTLTVDARIDVTPIRNLTGRNIVLFNFDGLTSGTIKLFKLDMLYQVQGIR